MNGSEAAPVAGAENRVGELFAESAGIMARLRAPGGCPWDREQTFDSIRKYTLEETYEVLDAIERQHWPDLAEELGDLLLQVLFYAQMAADAGYFHIEDVLTHLNRKLVRRHPHVFGEEAAAAAGNNASVDAAGVTESAHVLRNWEAIKQAEKAARGENGVSAKPAAVSLLDGVPRNVPALLEAGKLGARAAKVGFDWGEPAGILAKLGEECEELRAEVEAQASRRAGDAAHPSEGGHADAVEGELGDLLFTAVNLARHLRLDPEAALKHANGKFRERFRAMETASASPLEALTADELEALWRQAKERERAGLAGAVAAGDSR